MNADAFDTRICELGEGPLWHPKRQQFFWFDILGMSLLSREGDQALEWQFDEHVSAAGWIDHDRLMVASETALWQFDLSSGEQSFLCALEAENPVTRSNDGRADPWGGFWIGTMGKEAEPNAGAIYRYYRGELRKVAGQISISNSICFAPDRSVAYFTDTPTKTIMRVALEAETGWPTSAPQTHLDLTAFGSGPDGAVTDKDGNLWLATWGAGAVVCYAPDGTLVQTIKADAKQTSCPAFGGPNLRDLYITSAAVGLEDSGYGRDGCTFVARDVAQGLPEPRVIL